MTPALSDIVEKFQSAKGLDQLWSVALKELEARGVTSVLYAAAGFKSELIAPNFTRSLFIKTNHPREFVELFGQESLLDGDYSAQWCAANSTEILRWHVFDEDDASTPDQLRRADLERQLGLHVGVSIPTTALAGQNGGLGLSMSEVSVSGFEAHWSRFGSEILFICSLLDTAMRQTGVSEMAKLSPRERQCLEYLAAGYKVCQLGELMGISDKTAEKFLPLARRKVRASTTEQAIAKALLFNMIAP